MSTIVYQEEEYIELCERDDTQEILTNPIKYFLEHIHDEDIMGELKWTDPYMYEHVLRLHAVHQMQNHEHIYTCPTCHNSITTDEWGEEYCETCGLVTRTHYDYVAGIKIHLPFGLK